MRWIVAIAVIPSLGCCTAPASGYLHERHEDGSELCLVLYLNNVNVRSESTSRHTSQS